MESEYILIIADCDDSLQHENPGPSNRYILRAVVGVLPKDSIILLMAADYIRKFEWFASGGVVPAIKVFDQP
jgi:hypothetical protein